MAGEFVYGQAVWPGVVSFEGATYTLSHGISPGMCVLRCAPQDTEPALFGDLLLTDGEEEVLLPDCRLQTLKVERDSNGFYWMLEILDRRWRWRDFGILNGMYNQYAPLGQLRLLPWTVRSPRELAELCLQEMGEENYEINLPPGIDNPGMFCDQAILNVSGVNPPVDWRGIPPMQALQQVAERCGCRIIYRWSDDSILIAPVGLGEPLPIAGESIAKILPRIQPPKAPSAVGVRGDPTRFQARLALTAVGEEWDGSYVPIELLSYAPQNPGKAGLPQISTFTFTNPRVNTDYKILAYDDQGNPVVISVYMAGLGDTIQGIVDGLLANLNARGLLPGVAFASGNGGESITATGPIGKAFKVGAEIVPPIPVRFPPPTMSVAVTQEAEEPQAAFADWSMCFPPIFQGVVATPRLSLQDAQRLAQKSVWKCYQLTGIDVSGNGNPNIPGYGAVEITQQILLTATQVDQIEPEPQLQGVLQHNISIGPPDAPNNGTGGNLPLTVNFYNGFARDMPAAVYGSIGEELVHNYVVYPQLAGSPQISDIYIPGTVLDEAVTVVITVQPNGPTVTGSSVLTGNTATDIANLADFLNTLCQQAGAAVAVTSDGEGLVLTATENNLAFTVTVHVVVPEGSFAPPTAVVTRQTASGPQLNTPKGSQVMVPFQVDAPLFLIRFGQFVFALNDDYSLKVPSLVLQTGVFVRDPDNNQLVAYSPTRELPFGDPATPPLWRHYPDVQENITSSYDDDNNLLSFAPLENDHIVRAQHYLDGMANEFQIKAGQTVEYNGIVAVDADPGIWQITWNIGHDGCSTTVSQNAEHSIWIPPYPARRRAEYLSPVTRIDETGNRVNVALPPRGNGGGA